MKKLITVLLIAAIVSTSAIALTGCKSSENTDATTASEAATVAATAAAQSETKNADNAANQSAAQNDQQTGGQSADSGSGSDSAQSAEYAGITQENAIEHVKGFYGYDVEISGIYQGTYDAMDCDAWVVTVTEADGYPRTYYCGYAFCVPADIGNGEYVSPDPAEQDFTEEQAIANVEMRISDTSQVVSSVEGTTPDGLDCYVVTVDNADGSQTVYYSGLLFCYPAE